MKKLHTALQLFKNSNLPKFKVFFLSSFIWFLSSGVAFAANASGSSSGTGVTLVNPLKMKTAEDLLTTILEIVVILATPFIVFFIIYAGFLYVTARGNAEQITQANRALTYAIIGGVIIIGSVAIATIVKNIVSAF